MERFGDNLYRVMGLHRLTAADAKVFIDVSAQTLSEWKRGKSPNLNTLLRVAEFFEIHGDRLINAPFTELLTNELCDPDRFERVEHKIRAHQTTLRAIDSGEPVDVMTGKPANPQGGVDKSNGR
jgi:transcriptional regulator with XRE-family HTH domain